MEGYFEFKRIEKSGFSLRGRVSVKSEGGIRGESEEGKEGQQQLTDTLLFCLSDVRTMKYVMTTDTITRKSD
jgi:hypothetical protein